MPVNSFDVLELSLLVLQLLFELLLAKAQMLQPLPQLSLSSGFLLLLLLEPLLALNCLLALPPDLIITLLQGLRQQEGR